mmetsp:Transcript_51516/g.167148  ORF Transcript_51516/g.167148 Transcript_51516/m.167148 type:complete len:210 (+) Transcript_51516:213-842(+)
MKRIEREQVSLRVGMVMSGSIRRFSMSFFFSTLAGYGFLFSTCASAVVFIANKLLKHHESYSALFTQQSHDFSSLSDNHKALKKCIEEAGDQYDPKEHKSPVQGHLLVKGIKKLAWNPNNDQLISQNELLTILASVDQRLNILDALDVHNAGAQDKDVIGTFLESEEAKLFMRQAAGHSKEEDANHEPLLAGASRGSRGQPGSPKSCCY